MGIFCFLWLCFGVIFQPFEVIQPEDHCGTVKSFSLVGFHLSWVRLGSHLWIFSAAFRSGSFAGEPVYGEVTAIQVITFHKESCPWSPPFPDTENALLIFCVSFFKFLLKYNNFSKRQLRELLLNWAENVQMLPVVGLFSWHSGDPVLQK